MSDEEADRRIEELWSHPLFTTDEKDLMKDTPEMEGLW